MSGTGNDQGQQSQINALIAAALAEYALSDAQVTNLAATLAQFRIDEMQAVLDEALSNLENDDGDYSLPDDLVADQQAQAKQNAAAIAATYTHDVETAASAFLAAWVQDHGSVEGARQALFAHLRQWAQERAAWKSAQIAAYETGLARNAAMNQIIDDLLDGTLDSGGITLYVMVLPEGAAEPYCEEFAGELYTLEEAADLPEFPAHIGCVHYKMFTTGN